MGCDERMTRTIAMNPLGFIQSPYQSLDAIPMQGNARGGTQASFTMLDEFAPGMRDIRPDDWLLLVFYFHQAANKGLRVFSRGLQREAGIFSTRSPHRPNRIGCTVVRCTRVEGNTIHFIGADMLDGTPVLDIKPWNPLPVSPLRE